MVATSTTGRATVVVVEEDAVAILIRPWVTFRTSSVSTDQNLISFFPSALLFSARLQAQKSAVAKKKGGKQQQSTCLSRYYLLVVIKSWMAASWGCQLLMMATGSLFDFEHLLYCLWLRACCRLTDWLLHPLQALTLPFSQLPASWPQLHPI